MRRWILFAALLTMCFILSGCGAEVPESAPASGSSAAISKTDAESAPIEEAAVLDRETAASDELDTDSSESTAEETVSPENKEQNMILKINGEAIPVSWEDNEAVAEMLEDLLSGDITVSMSMYGGFEQVGSLGHAYTQNDAQITTQPGDIVLYSGSNIVLFYGSNTWAYTRLGTMDLSEEELHDLLENGDIELTLTIE